METWNPMLVGSDGPGMQSAAPPGVVIITGIYDETAGHPGVFDSLIPANGSTSNSSHKIVGTIDKPYSMGSDGFSVYRDGVKLFVNAHLFEGGKSSSGTTWWFVDTDVPPGPHTYTARFERTYGPQGDWSESYVIHEQAHDQPALDSSSGK
jgi:hypothetical protein